MNKKSVKVDELVKTRLEKLKEEQSLKSESEVIAYLMLMHDWGYHRISAHDHAQVKTGIRSYSSEAIII